MSWLARRWLPLTMLIVASAALVTSVVWVVCGTSRGPPAGSMTRPAVSSDGPVRDLAAAEETAVRFAYRWGLRVGEVMQFDNGFYAELIGPTGPGATEVLIDPDSGDVHPE